jgi:hypothetical protein
MFHGYPAEICPHNNDTDTTCTKTQYLLFRGLIPRIQCTKCNPDIFVVNYFTKFSLKLFPYIRIPSNVRMTKSKSLDSFLNCLHKYRLSILYNTPHHTSLTVLNQFLQKNMTYTHEIGLPYPITSVDQL